MLAQLTISHIPLSDNGVMIEYVDSDGGTYERFYASQADAEYVLLAQAINKFMEIVRIKEKSKTEKKMSRLTSDMSSLVEQADKLMESK